VEGLNAAAKRRTIQGRGLCVSGLSEVIWPLNLTKHLLLAVSFILHN
jgi:hypothetical protein